MLTQLQNKRTRMYSGLHRKKTQQINNLVILSTCKTIVELVLTFKVESIKKLTRNK